jgi:hypothetical protein
VRLPGILSRSGALNKIMLSPETSTLAEMQAVTRALMADGVRTFSLTLHSPSVEPGHTEYVRTAADLRAFLDRIAAYCDFFFGTLGGVPATLDGISTDVRCWRGCRMKCSGCRRSTRIRPFR